MSYSDSLPAQRPSFIFDAANSGRIPPNATFSRDDSPINASNAPASAVHFWSNEKHLSSENLLPYSNDLSASDWTKVRLTVDSTNNTAPDGGSNASSILETADTGTHSFYDAFNCVSGQNYSFVFYAKPNGRTKLLFRPQATGIIASLVFDLSGSGTVTLSSGSTVSHSITQVGDYYKCQATVTATATGAGYTQVYLDNGSGTSYAGDVTKGMLFWGFSVSSTGETILNETSGSIHREYASTLKSVATAGAARFEYDPTDGQSEGILIEGQSTNLLNYSEQFDNAYWTKYRATITANAAIAPSGELTADLFVAEQTGSSQTHIVQSASQSYTSGTAYTFSIFVKPAGFSKIRIAAANTSTWAAAADYDLSGSGSVSGVTGTASTEDCGGGWFRCILTGTAGASASTPTYVFLDNGSGTSFDGDDFSGVILWGAMHEQASHSSSYIKVEASTATRAADSLSVATANIGLTAGQDVTLYAEGDFGDPAIKNSNRFAVALQENSNSYIILYNGGSNSGSGYVRDGGTDQAYFSSGVTAGEFKAAIAAKNNSFKYAVNGTSSTEDTAGTVPKYTTLRVGGLSASGVELDGHVKRVAVYGQSLSSSELAAITS